MQGGGLKNFPHRETSEGTMNLKQWRKQNGKTLHQVAADTGISKSQLHRLENGLNTVINIEAAMKIETYTKGQVTVRDLMPLAAA